MPHSTTTWMIALTAATALAVGCSSSSSAPFHMYSSPLLEGEMQTPPADAEEADDPEHVPGVEPRQVYAYQRWHQRQAGQTRSPDRRRTINGGQPGTFDTVEPRTDSVLASHTEEPTGDGAAATDAGAVVQQPDEPRRESERVADELDAPADEAAPSTMREPAAAAADFVTDVLEVNDIEMPEDASESIPTLFRECRARGETFQTDRPDIGDLVFFHNTYDANDDGRNNDWYTLVGIVEDLRSDGTVEFLTYHDGDVSTRMLNLEDIGQHRDRGATLNSRLRERTADDPPFTQYLAGQLFAGYCDILGDRPELILIDEWSPTAANP